MVRVVVLLALGLMLMGCVRSLEPVITPEQAVKVPEVEGKWTSAKGSKESLDVTGDGNGYKVVYVNEDGKSGTFNAVFGHVGEMMISDITPTDPPESAGTQVMLMVPAHLAVRVTQTSPQLVVKMLKPDWFKKYVAQHPEEISTVTRDDQSIITASTQQIQAFLIKHAGDVDAWTDETAFVRSSTSATHSATQRATANP